MDDNVYVCRIWIDNVILSETIGNPNENVDKPLIEVEVTVVTIQQVKHALKTLKHLV